MSRPRIRGVQSEVRDILQENVLLNLNFKEWAEFLREVKAGYLVKLWKQKEKTWVGEWQVSVSELQGGWKGSAETRS